MRDCLCCSRVFFQDFQKIPVTMSPGRCFVDGCESYKSKEKISLFSAPKDPKAREIWNDILKHPLKILEASHFVCEQHFDSNDVIKCLHINEITLRNKITRLKKNCVPVPFIKPENTKYIDETEYENKLDVTLTNPSVMTECIKQEYIEPEIINFIDVKQETNIEFGNFFDELFENKYLFGLIEYWGIHSCESRTPPIRPCMILLVNTSKPKTVIFSQVGTREGFPVYEKQVIVNEELEIKYFVGQTMVDLGLPKICANSEELCNAINQYSKFKLCRGGPSCVEYKEIVHITNCAYKDAFSRSWRHKNCNFFTQDEMQPCLFCQALRKYFKTILRKSKKVQNSTGKIGSNDEVGVPKKKKRKLD